MVSHWDEAREFRADVGPMQAAWASLGKVAGSVAVGCHRIRIDRGRQSTPPHRHGAQEEIFYVLRGDGLSWQDGATHEVRAGDALVHRAGREAHTLVAGDEGLDVLAFGQRTPVEAGHLPRAGVAWLGRHAWAEVGGGPHPWEREAALGPVEAGAPVARPDSIVALAEVPAGDWGRGDVGCQRRDLGRAAGSVTTGLNHITVAPGALSSPPHCHSAEEELFVVLEGDGQALLGDDEHAVRAGSVVARPAGTGVAHCFRAGDGGLALLAYGTREPNDICFYPRSGKVSLRGIKAIFRVEKVDYWDGEPS